MYCKNCGRELKEGARFCDRCGQSVRRGQNSERAQRQHEAEKLKQERIERKRIREEQEAEKARLREIRRKKNRKRNRILIVVFILLMLMLVSGIVTYIITSSTSNQSSWKTKDETQAANSTVLPTIKPVGAEANATAQPTVVPETPTPEPVVNNDPTNSSGYKVSTISAKVKCPYPADFEKQSISEVDKNTTKLSVLDPKGGATIKVKEESIDSSKKASVLMKEYAQSMQGKTVSSLAGNGWYGITIEKNNVCYHRKCVLNGDKQYYYEFQYSLGSGYDDKYNKYITYMDDHFSG